MLPCSGRTRLRVLAGCLVITIGLWLLVQRHVGNLAYFVITSESMEPTLHIGDRVIMKRIVEYTAGDIVVLDNPDRTGQRLVKRIVAVPGDLVIASGDNLEVFPPPAKAPGGGKRRWVVPEDHVFVAGDNRAGSRDSREFGPVPLSSIRGKVRYRIVSLFRWETVK